MKSINKKAAGARGIPQTFNRPAGQVPKFKPVVAQLKTRVSSQGVKRPVAPPVFRPQPMPKVAQPKLTTETVNRKPPIAPSVYRPQSTPLLPKIAQARMAVTPPKPGVSASSMKHPVAPPVYRPQQEPKVLQTKRAGGQSPRPGQTQRPPAAPQVYRPEARKIVQPKTSHLQAKTAVSQKVPQRLQAQRPPAGAVSERGHFGRSSIQTKSPSNLPYSKPAPQGRQPSTELARLESANLPGVRHRETQRNLLVARPPPGPAAQALTRSRPPAGTVQRSAPSSNQAPIPDDVLPFVSEQHRADICNTDITERHRGVHVFQCTKLRNLPGIRALGLLACRGGSRIGLSQNPSQREALLARSIAHSQGVVTVGTSSVVIDNYKKKASEWHQAMLACFRQLATSLDWQTIEQCRRRLQTMQWLDDARLSVFLGFPLENMISSGHDSLVEIAQTLREIYDSLCYVVELNEPIVIRFRSNLAKWTVDPDDPQGYQTPQSISDSDIEVLYGNAWVPINDDALNSLMGRITRAAAHEDDLLNVDFVRAQRRERRRRERMGMFGRSEATHTTPEETAALMGL